ncbi:MAG TPA: electron transport complex subunit RsxC [Candidatus Hydrogenedentes bacterium]|nr:electron transport complex subunit RsxC [Candidatus Hydrogenedentota bacterium]
MGTATLKKTFSHGIHPPEHKAATVESAITPLPFPPGLVIPLSQHTGAPARPIVEPKQEVARGDKIAEAGGFVSVPMHAPAKSTVAKIGLALTPSGAMTPAIFLKVDLESEQEPPPEADSAASNALTPEELVAAVQETGMVGLGGAAFPTHVKMLVPKGKRVDTVVVNGCECEPYLTTDHRVMLEASEDLFTGVRIALRATQAGCAIIGIETNKPDAIKALAKAAESDSRIRVAPVKTKYPQGAEKMLIKALLKREVPSGGLPIDVNAAVFNVATLAQLGRLLPRKQGLIERVVTVTGPGVERPGNYLVPLGTPVQFLLDHAGMKDTARQVILGGPMMGVAIASLEIPVTKGVSGILVLTDKELAQRPTKVYPCIRCGQCIQACPMFLNPSRLGLLSRKEQYAVMEERYHLNDCFECGCCAYVCPSNIPLVQYMRIAKAVNRERKTAK